MKVQCYSVLVLLLLLPLVCSIPATTNKDLARSEWILGFHKLEEAEYSEEFGNYEKALDLLNEARRIFKKVKDVYTTWNQSLLNYRIKYCEQKIRKIEKLNDLLPIDVDDLEKKAKENKELHRINQNLKKSNTELKQQIATLAAEVERVTSLPQGTTKIKVLEKELERINRQKTEISSVNSNLETQISVLNEEMDRLRTEQGKSIMKIAEKDRDNKFLLAKISDQEQKIDQFDQLFELKQERIRDLDLQASKLKRVQKKFDTLSAELDKEKERTVSLFDEKEKLEVRLENSLSELEISKNKIQNQKDEITAITTSLDEERLKAAQIVEEGIQSKADLVQLREHNAQLQKNVDEAKNKLTVCSNRMRALQQQVDSNSSELTELREKNERTSLEFEEQKKHLGFLKKEIEFEQTTNKLFQETVRSLKEEMAVKTEQETTLKSELSDYKEKILAFEKKQHVEREKYHALLGLNKELKSKIKDLHAQLVISDEIQANLTNLKTQLGRARKLGDEFHDMLQKVETQDQEILKDDSEREMNSSRNRSLSRTIQHQEKTSELSNTNGQKKILSDKKIAQDTTNLKHREDQQSEVNHKDLNENVESLKTDETIDLLLAQGEQAFQSGQSQEAKLKFMKILKLNRSHMGALLGLSKTLIEAKDFENAEKSLKKAYQIDPQNPEILSQLGYVLIQQEKNSLAIWTLNKAVTLHPDNPVLFQLLGTAYTKIGRLDTAEIQLKRAFDLDKTNAFTARNLAILYAAMEPPRVESLKDWYELAKNLGAKNDPNLDDLLKEYTSH